ncbi:MAG: DAK2 domain-containing protein, partial [Stackebrandtia sp.]
PDECGHAGGAKATAAPSRPVIHKPTDDDGRGLVVLAEAPGLAKTLDDEDVRTLTAGSPSTVEILAAIRATDCRDVVVLADTPVHAVAESAGDLARAHGCRVSVIPMRSPVQALAALAVRDASRRYDDDVIAMAEAAGACRHAEVTVAARAGLTSVGRCEAGDYLGMADGDVTVFGSDLDEVLCELVDRFCAAGVELLTIVAGAKLSIDAADRLEVHVEKRWPMVEVHRFDGGQRRHLVWIGAE